METMLNNYTSTSCSQKKMIVILFHCQIEHALSDLVSHLMKYYDVLLLDLSIKKEFSNDFGQNHFFRNDVELINHFYEKCLLSSVRYSDGVVFISADSAMVSVLTWIHDFSPRIKASILFSSGHKLHSIYRKEIKKIAYDSLTITCPVMMILPGKNQLWKDFYKKLTAIETDFIILKGNSISQVIYEKLMNFIEASYNLDIDNYSLLNADKEGFTFEEKEILRQPEKSLYRRFYWKTHRVFLRVAGFFSDGIQIGLKHGFDSGSMLDYIYLNKPKGKTWIGFIIDRFYLNSIPWQGARQRENHVNHYLLTSIRKLLADEKKVNIMDLSAGHGKYLFDLPDSAFEDVHSVILRDYDENNCSFGNNIINSRKLNDKITYEKGDAFSSTDLASLATDRTIAIASGFYELFDDNALVTKSLKGVFNALDDGGFFIYTGIIFHPRHVYMARVLTRNSDKGSWLIRRRFQQELDQLVQAAGFTKISQKVDPWGIFSVSLAQKLTAE